MRYRSWPKGMSEYSETAVSCRKRTRVHQPGKFQAGRRGSRSCGVVWQGTVLR